jgi:hypothetical protein
MALLAPLGRDPLGLRQDPRGRESRPIDDVALGVKQLDFDIALIEHRTIVDSGRADQPHTSFVLGGHLGHGTHLFAGEVDPVHPGDDNPIRGRQTALTCAWISLDDPVERRHRY